MTEKLDVPMNTFTPATDAEYIYAEATDGSQVKIKKSDLISLLKNRFSYVDVYNYSGDISNISKTGIYMIFSGATNTPTGSTVQGSVLFNMFWNIDTIKQMYFPYDYNGMYIRYKRGNAWTDWRKL